MVELWSRVTPTKHRIDSVRRFLSPGQQRWYSRQRQGVLAAKVTGNGGAVARRGHTKNGGECRMQGRQAADVALDREREETSGDGEEMRWKKRARGRKMG